MKTGFSQLRVLVEDPRLPTCAVILLISIQLSCGQRQQPGEIMNSANQNDIRNEGMERIETGQLELELKSDQSEVGPGECTDLHLDVSNPSSSRVSWSAGWTLDQQGPSPSLPDGIGSVVNIPPGKSVNFMTIRICAANRVPGTYRFRITAAKKSANMLQSNWATVEILP